MDYTGLAKPVEVVQDMKLPQHSLEGKISGNGVPGWHSVDYTGHAKPVGVVQVCYLHQLSFEKGMYKFPVAK